MSEINLNFYPWLRRGLAQALTNTQPTADPAIEATVHLNGEAVSPQSLVLRGPADVIGISHAQVVRVEPTDSTTDFEYAFFPFVEFSTPDLPWLFTPAGASDTLRPWLALVVVEQQQATLRTGSANMPLILETTRDQLPTLAQSWAWAHVQVMLTSTLPQDPAEALETMPEAFTSRLMAPRLLDARTDYLACVVPAFMGGVQAGLGQPVDRSASANDAWDDNASDDTPVMLPVYYSWRFSTGSAGEFETLARRLERVEFAPDVGTVTLDVGDAGSGMPVVPGQTATFMGALAATNAARPGFTDSKGFGEHWREAIRGLLRDEVLESTAPGRNYDALVDDPVVAPPLYGGIQANIPGIPEANEQPRWLRALNANPHNRAAAGLGAAVVRADQEALMADAWRQADAIRRVNRLFQATALARRVSSTQYAKLASAEVGDATVLQLSRPAHSRIRFSNNSTILGVLKSADIPDGVVSPPFRRATRPGSVVARRIERRQVPSPEQQQRVTVTTRVTKRVIDEPTLYPVLVKPRVIKGTGIARPLPAPTMPSGSNTLPDLTPVLDRDVDLIIDLATRTETVINGVLQSTTSTNVQQMRGALLDAQLQATEKATQYRSYAAQADAKAARDLLATATAFDNIAAQANAAINTTVRTNPAPLRQMVRSLQATRTQVRALQQNNGARLAVDKVTDFRREPLLTPRLDPGIERRDTTIAASTVSMAVVADTVRARLDPAPALAARVNERINVPADVWDKQPQTMPARVGVVPEFTRPLYRRLIALGAHFMVPGIGSIGNNVVGLLEVNAAFVEAFLVGANHELSREFLWREYPTDLRGTWMRRFWEADKDDIPAIGTDWKPDVALGENTIGDATSDALVLLARGDLFRRYPNVIVSAIPAKWDGNLRVPDTARPREEPDFSGRLPGGAAFYGFNGFDAPAANGTHIIGGNAGYFFILEEHPTAPRFGVNESETYGLRLNRITDWNDLSRGHFANDAASLPTYVPVTGPQREAQGLRWNKDSANTAAITLQRPVRVYIHASELLPGS